ncbi:alpha/beta hydrolase [Nocardia cyriacigeorgica]|uniref:alpha/beta hydrolase n=1 Tax=Nocardia cyriacigeorgica TaxID=135487 RepID=UPI0013CFF08C|nr:alpha/beta hydrolase [Nocardia cyriacigeorgica]MBF6439350.1 alpha/beta fold hydrolase [Nocardia cyriacigeorgica]MBF6455610.1 alpha/beta fold hydrolase [Nocardia cyriacigeorgica]MBF6477522.1 alpha/beta fold hydrolase [Nocardia cyriacigeorgica]MBF6553648.1 alpha/beta fold hydrolase [Nocardia cyriacigeorgica]NEW28210.1 alpha/beta fold hydrolase [Nocardia cyriacigeorgica]
MERVEVSFPSGGEQCAAWLYRPDGVPKPRPLVVMGHGLGANREMGLDRYARRFAAAGMGVLVFDYRHFGASDGAPRQLLHIARQREDWHAAIAYARTIRGFDATRIALWGTSFGGGHVLSVAPDDAYIAAVVAQVPFTSGWASAMAKGPTSLTKVATIAATDLLIGPIRRKPVPVRLAGRKRAAALMSAPDVPEGFGRLAEESESYQPKVAARVAFSALFDAPGRRAKALKMPVLYALCDNDSVAPVKPALRAAERTKHAIVKRYDAGHFDIYFDDVFEQAVHDQTEFLVSVLRP